MVAMTKVIRWETGADAASFSRTLTPDQIMDKLEERVGPDRTRAGAAPLKNSNGRRPRPLSRGLECRDHDDRERRGAADTRGRD
jgi:hypothetical protein